MSVANQAVRFHYYDTQAEYLQISKNPSHLYFCGDGYIYVGEQLIAVHDKESWEAIDLLNDAIKTLNDNINDLNVNKADIDEIDRLEEYIGSVSSSANKKIDANTTAIKDLKTSKADATTLKEHIDAFTAYKTTVANNLDAKADKTTVVTLQETVTSQGSTITTNIQDISNLKTRCNGFQGSIQDLDDNYRNLDNQISDNTSEIAQINTQLETIESDLNNKVSVDEFNLIEDTVNNKIPKTYTLQSDHNALSATVSENKNSISTNTGAITALQNKDATLEGKIKTNSDNIVTLQGTVGGHTTTIANHTSTLATHSSQITALQGTDDDLQEQISANDKDIKNLQDKDLDLEQNIDNHATQIKNLQDKDTSLTNAINTEKGRIDTLVTDDEEGSIRKRVLEILAEQLIEGSNDFATLQQLAAWLDEHPESVAEMNQNISDNTSAISDLSAELNGKINETAESIRGELEAEKNALNGAIQAEEARAVGVEDNLRTSIEINAGGIVDLDAAIKAEEIRALGVEGNLRTDVNTNAEAIVNVNAALADAVLDLEKADIALGERIDGVNEELAKEAGTRATRDEELTNLINKEAERAQGVEETISKNLEDARDSLEGRIGVEETNRINADNALSASINQNTDAINNLIDALTWKASM